MRNDELYLVDILEATDAVNGFLRNVSQDEFCSSDLIRSATLQKLIIVGEAASCLSASVRDATPQVPWPLVRAFRNFAVHVYFAVKWNKVWDIAHTELPALAHQVEDILHAEFPATHAEFLKRNRPSRS